MPFQKLQFRPGIIRDVPAYTNTGGWYDCNLVRFRNGFPQSVGGWQKYLSTPFLGICRDIINWVTNSGTNYLGLGTTCKYYLENGGTLSDITPIRETVVLSNPFTATNGSAVITVNDVAHGCTAGDYVTYSGATSLGGNITAAILNQEYSVTTIVDSDNYTITASVSANASDTGNGGASVTAAYQINVGLDTEVGGTGWGAGTWGRGTWGSATTISVGNSLRLWSSDNFGQDLIFGVRNGGIYYWSPSYGAGSRAVDLDSLSTDVACPNLATVIRVSENDRHVIAFGGNNYFNSNGSINNAQDPLLIKWSDQEDYTTWTPSATNSAGDLRLSSGTRIVHVVETNREILVWTDTALYSMQYLGPPYTFGINQIAAGTTVLGYNSFANVDDFVFWFGNGKFYGYNGRTSELPCPIKGYIFSNINYNQTDKIFAGINTQYNEVTWFYPSANSSENDSYVTYNYGEKAWTYGTMARTAWIDRSADQYPIAASPDGYLYSHEVGTDDGSTNPASAISSYIQSAPTEIESGERFSFIKKVIPDITFYNSTDNPQAIMSLKVQRFPGSNFNDVSESDVAQTATVPIEQFTEQVFVRLRGRQVSFRIESDKVGTGWGLGTPRLEIQTDGKR
jgi:hypothetical protein